MGADIAAVDPFTRQPIPYSWRIDFTPPEGGTLDVIIDGTSGRPIHVVRDSKTTIPLDELPPCSSGGFVPPNNSMEPTRPAERLAFVRYWPWAGRAAHLEAVRRNGQVQPRARTIYVRQFKRGGAFPHEGFVQAAIERHFAVLGFIVETDSYADLVCCHPTTGIRWLIEAKGATSSIGLDFRTGLGQVGQRMNDPTVNYGLALPKDERFLSQCRTVSRRVREALRLHWLVVDPDGSITILAPDQDP